MMKMVLSNVLVYCHGNPSDTIGGNLIVVHGDDPNTAEIDGAHGEIIWKTNIDGQAVVLFADIWFLWT